MNFWRKNTVAMVEKLIDGCKLPFKKTKTYLDGCQRLKFANSADGVTPVPTGLRKQQKPTGNAGSC
jgi:hypothetical protein